MSVSKKALNWYQIYNVDAFYGCEKVEKTSWFCDLFMFLIWCFYSNLKGCKVLINVCERSSICQYTVYETGNFSV